MKKHSKFEKDFAITLRYSTTPLEAFAERAAGGPRRAGLGTQSSVAMPTFDVEEAAMISACVDEVEMQSCRRLRASTDAPASCMVVPVVERRTAQSESE